MIRCCGFESSSFTDKMKRKYQDDNFFFIIAICFDEFFKTTIATIMYYNKGKRRKHIDYVSLRGDINALFTRIMYLAFPLLLSNVCLLVLMLWIPVNTFQSYRDVSFVEPILSRR